MTSISADDIQKKAQEVFGVKSLTKEQIEAVSLTLQKENTFVFLPTGAGKSMCFYLIPLLQPDSTIIIISPLVALMSQQVKELESRNLTATYVCAENKADALRSIEKGVQYIFCTPEQAADEKFRAAMIKIRSKIKLLAIDEAHCIYQSNADFRMEYKMLAFIKEALGCPVMCLTATPIAEVRALLPSNLGLKDFKLVTANLDRPELFLEVETIDSMSRLPARVISQLKKQDGLTMIFVQDKNKVRELWKQVAKEIPQTEMFHADLTSEQKNIVLEEMMEGKLKVVITTSALGMGMTIPKVRWVILFGLPDSILDLCQQLGRACRDHALGTATLLISKRQRGANDHAMQDLVEQYAFGKKCKRASLLESSFFNFCNVEISSFFDPLPLQGFWTSVARPFLRTRMLFGLPPTQIL